LRGYEKRVRHSNITRTALEEDLINLGSEATWKKYLLIVEHNLQVVKFTLQRLPVQVVHSRIASHLIPVATLKSFDKEKTNYELVLEKEKILALCQEIRAIIKEKKITVSMHSSQFVSLGADDEEIKKNSQAELIYCARILELISEEAVITTQLNSKKEMVEKFEKLGKEEYLRWTAKAVRQLPDYVLAKISLENEMRGFWNSVNLYKFHLYFKKEYGISFPLVWDNAHEAANPSRISENKENWEWFVGTWPNRTPLFYWSESCGKNKVGHCDYYHQKILPPSSTPIWVCEIKMKELALQELLKSSKINLEGDVEAPLR